MLKEYRVSDLVQHPEQMPVSVTAFHWVEKHEVTPEVDRLRVTTKEKRTFEFDIATGALLNTADARPTGATSAGEPVAVPAAAAAAPRSTAVAVGAGVAVVAALGGLFVWRRRRNRE